MVPNQEWYKWNISQVLKHCTVIRNTVKILMYKIKYFPKEIFEHTFEMYQSYL